MNRRGIPGMRYGQLQAEMARKDIELAIAAERERCAKLAESIGEKHDHDECCCELIAAKIRSGE